MLIEIILYTLAPVIAFVYKILDFYKIIDKMSGRELRILGLNRLKLVTGYPKGWIYNESDDKIIFNALFKIISKNTKSEKLKKVLDKNITPSLICVVGLPNEINGIDPNWEIHERSFYSGNQPVMLIFNINKTNQNQIGKGERACTLEELGKWIDEEKRNREFWIGTVSITIISISLLISKLFVIHK